MLAMYVSRSAGWFLEDAGVSSFKASLSALFSVPKVRLSVSFQLSPASF
jgi:hypothetical protein